MYVHVVLFIPLWWLLALLFVRSNTECQCITGIAASSLLLPCYIRNGTAAAVAATTTVLLLDTYSMQAIITRAITITLSLVRSIRSEHEKSISITRSRSWSPGKTDGSSSLHVSAPL